MNGASYQQLLEPRCWKQNLLQCLLLWQSLSDRNLFQHLLKHDQLQELLHAKEIPVALRTLHRAACSVSSINVLRECRRVALVTRTLMVLMRFTRSRTSRKATRTISELSCSKFFISGRTFFSIWWLNGLSSRCARPFNNQEDWTHTKQYKRSDGKNTALRVQVRGWGFSETSTKRLQHSRFAFVRPNSHRTQNIPICVCVTSRHTSCVN